MTTKDAAAERQALARGDIATSGYMQLCDYTRREPKPGAETTAQAVARYFDEPPAPK
ncbi:MAG TPA: hypothetical protein VG735_07820 [Caulobacterales bacterium]|nr:hypothetical protein [Caulobacterales bacterium]